MAAVAVAIVATYVDFHNIAFIIIIINMEKMMRMMVFSIFIATGCLVAMGFMKVF